MNPTPSFTRAQWDALLQDERRAVDAVCAGLRDGPLPRDVELTDAFLSTALNLLRPATNAEENDGDFTWHLQRKFRAIYQAGLTLAEGVLARHGKKPVQDYSFLLLIEADASGTAQVVVFDPNAPRRYLHERTDAMVFASLPAIAAKVLDVRHTLVAAVLHRHISYVVVQGGAVLEVTDLPPGLDVHVVDYDVAHREPDQLQISPLDGAACVITKF